MEMSKPEPLILSDRVELKDGMPVIKEVPGKQYVKGYHDANGVFHPPVWRKARAKKSRTKSVETMSNRPRARTRLEEKMRKEAEQANKSSDTALLKSLQEGNDELRTKLREYRRINDSLSTNANKDAHRIAALERELAEANAKGNDYLNGMIAKQDTISTLQKIIVLISSFRQEK